MPREVQVVWEAQIPSPRTILGSSCPLEDQEEGF
jgi:hypothetical protein